MGDPERDRLREDLQRGLQRRARDARCANERVACGVTGAARQQQPDRARGRRSRRSRSCAPSKTAGLKTFDAWAHHPYYAGAERHADDEAGDREGRAGDRGHARQPQRPDHELLTQLYGNKRIWITEYGYQTNPPDTLFGVSWAKQARLPDAGVRDRAQEPAHRHDALVPAQGRAEPRRLAVGPDHVTRRRRSRRSRPSSALPRLAGSLRRDGGRPRQLARSRTGASPPRSSSTWVVRAALAALAAGAGGRARRSARRCASSTSAAASSRTTRSSRASPREYVGVDVVENPAAELLGPVEALPVDDASFDVVLCTQVLEHCDDPAQAVRELRRVTAPGGRVLASTHGVQVYHPSPGRLLALDARGPAPPLRARTPTGRRCRVEPGGRHRVRRSRCCSARTSRSRCGGPFLARPPVWLLNRAGAALDARSARRSASRFRDR